MARGRGGSLREEPSRMPVAGNPGSSLAFPGTSRPFRMRSVHSKLGHQTLSTALDKSKKPRPKKGNGVSKYEMFKKSAIPDYTDVAYREAVSRLRYLLNESYVPPPSKYPFGGAKPEESDEESGVSAVGTDRTRTTRLSPYRRPYFPTRLYSKPQHVSTSTQYGEESSENTNTPATAPELMNFIERQEEYIDQLEKEAQYCRDELSQLLGKVKELITENENLQHQQKSGLMKAMFGEVDEGRLSEYENPEKYRKRLEGPMIVFESRISELEAQLTQSKIDLRKAQEEAEMYKRKLEDCQPSSSNYDFYKQIENLQREKRDLNESLAKLQASINQIREKEIDASKKVQRTLDVVDKTQFEKQQAEMEVYRLKSELELQHDKLLEVISEQTRKVADERGQAERRYLQHVERLNAELTAQRDALSKMQMEVDKHLRIEEDLKRDLAAKNTTIENVKKELNNKIASLQAELSAALTERDSLEQELSTSRMSGERTERLNKQESGRLQVEISALRQRLDRGDAELIHCRRENLRLLEQISTLEKELTLYKIKLGEKKDPIEEEEEKAKEMILNSRISEIESKHVKRVSELEGLIENQSQVMAKLKAECQSLTQKLEESTARHKEEMEKLQSKLNTLSSKMETNFGTRQWNLGDTYKEPESTAPDRTQYKTIAEEKKGKEGGEKESYSQLLSDEKSQRNGFDEPFAQNYGSSPQQSYSSIKSNILDGGYGSSAQYGEDYDKGGSDLKKESQNVYDTQGDYSNYESEQPSSNYQEQQSSFQQQPSYQEQPSSFQKQPSYQEQQSTFQQQPSFQEQQSNFQTQPSYQEQEQSFQQQPLYQEQQSSFQQQPLYQEQQSFLQHEQQSSFQQQPSFQEPTSTYQEQPSYQERTSGYQEQVQYQEQTPTYQDQPSYQELAPSSHEQKPVQEQPVQRELSITEESYPEVPPEPAFVPLAEPVEVAPPDPKPPTETPKSTISQRFQRAAELSRQASKSEDSPRGKLASQTRARNSQPSRVQQKTGQSRFK